MINLTQTHVGTSGECSRQNACADLKVQNIVPVSRTGDRLSGLMFDGTDQSSRARDAP